MKLHGSIFQTIIAAVSRVASVESLPLQKHKPTENWGSVFGSILVVIAYYT